MYKKVNTSAVILSSAVIIFCAMIAVFPGAAVTSAKSGLLLWFNNVLPSLLPFIIGINLLIKLGALNMFGKVLSPVMMPLFKVSGIGGFALIAGMISGYPMGANVVSSLRKDNLLLKSEAQRLIGFSNNTGPLFIIGAVGIGMFGSAIAGYFILSAHYLSAIISGILHRFYKPGSQAHIQIRHTAKINRQAYPFLTSLSESVKSAMETILMIGGFIILFSVLSALLNETGVIVYIAELLSYFGQFTDLSTEAISGVLTGIIEITNGASAVASSSETIHALLAVTGVISFGGFSIHAQAAGFIKETDLSFASYILSKIIHAILSVAIGIMILPFFNI